MECLVDARILRIGEIRLLHDLIGQDSGAVINADAVDAAQCFFRIGQRIDRLRGSAGKRYCIYRPRGMIIDLVIVHITDGIAGGID